MIIDRNEAFKHNACKKVAQLGKVIFTLTVASRDRAEERRQVMRMYNDQIDEIFLAHIKQAEEIHQGLIRYRKSCIDKACTDYGNLYKELKSDYAEVMSAQTNKIAGILEEIKQVKEKIAQYSGEVKTQTLLVNSSAEAMLKDAKQNGKPQTASNKEIKEATGQYDKKTKEIISDFEKRMKQLQNKHNNDVRSIKTEVSRLNKSVILTRLQTFKNFAGTAAQLHIDIDAIRKEYQNLLKAHQAFSKNSYETRTKIFQSTKKSLSEIKKQKQGIQRKEKDLAQQREMELSDINKTLQTIRANQKATLERIDRHIADKIKKTKKLNDNKSSETKKHQTALNSITQSIIDCFEEEKAKKKEAFEETISNLNDIHNDIGKLEQWTEKSINEGKERIGNKLIAFKYKFNQTYENWKQGFDKEKIELGKKYKDKIEVLNAAIDTQNMVKEGSYKDEKSDIKKIKSILKEKKQDYENEMASKKAEIEEETEIYKAGNENRRSQRKKELHNALKRKEKEKLKKLEEPRKKHSIEIAEKKVSIKNETDEKLKEIIKNFVNPKNDAELLETHQKKKRQLDSMLEYAVNQINTIKNNHQKAITKLQNDYTNQDKLKRQLQRRIETETRTLDDEYEMKIQVCQVDLQKSIENISKLYDEEENARGRDIIEAIRKVRETRNHNNDFLHRKKKDLDEIIKNHLTEVNKLQKELAQMKTGELELQYKQQIEEKQTNFQNLKTEIEGLATKRIQVIEESIQRLESEHEASKQKIEKTLKEKQKSFDIQTKEINEDIKSQQRVKTESLDLIKLKYEKENDELQKQHNIDAEKMRKRISQEKIHQEEVKNELDKKFNEIQKGFDEDIKEACEKNWSKINKSLEHRKKKSNELEEKISMLWQQQTDFETNSSKAPQRKEDTAKIAEIQTQSSTKYTDLNLKWSQLFVLLENGPDPSLVKCETPIRRHNSQKGITRSISRESVDKSHATLPPLSELTH